MPVSIVDLFEVVQIDKHQHPIGVRLAIVFDGARKVFVERGPVCKLGEWVVMCSVPQLVLGSGDLLEERVVLEEREYLAHQRENQHADAEYHDHGIEVADDQRLNSHDRRDHRDQQIRQQQLSPIASPLLRRVAVPRLGSLRQRRQGDQRRPRDEPGIGRAQRTKCGHGAGRRV